MDGTQYPNNLLLASSYRLTEPQLAADSEFPDSLYYELGRGRGALLNDRLS